MTCPICNGPRKDIVLRAEGRRPNEKWARCDACKVFFLKDLPTPEESLAIYKTGEYRKQVYKDRKNLRGLNIPDAFVSELVNEALRAQHTLMTIVAFGVTPRRLLDIGAGMGVMAWSAHREWQEAIVSAVEPLKEYVIVKGIPLFETLDEVTETYDTITCIHVLEHVPDPIQFLSKIAKHLEPGGKLFLEVPNYSPKDGNNPFQRSHLFAYTVEGLANVVRRVGLNPITYMTHGWLFRQGTDVSVMMVVEGDNENRSQG